MVRHSGKENATDSQTEHKKRNLRPLKTLFPYLSHNKFLVFSAFISLIIAALVMLALPVAIRRMLDHGFIREDGTLINSYFAVLFILAAILAIASAARYYSVITLGERIVAHLRRDVFAHIAMLSASFFDRSHSGELVSRLSSDTTQLKSAVGATASVALRNLIMAVGAVIMMVVTSFKLSILVLITIPIVVLPLIVFGRKVRARTRLAQDKLAEANTLASEQISAIRTVQAFTAERFITNRFGFLIDKAYEAARRSVVARAFLTGFAIFLVFGSVVAVLWIGAHDVLSGNLTGGTLGQFVLYAVFAASAFGQLSEVGAELAQASGAAERLAELLQEKPDITAPRKLVPLPQPPRGSIEFDTVNFSYPTKPDQLILNALSFQVKPTETVAFVGPSGAGKSTLFSLILRFYDPTNGTVKIDDIDIRHAAPQDVREHIAYVAQDTAIFDGTLRDNIAFGRPDASEEAIIAAAKAAHAYDFIMALPHGLDEKVGERGLMLSGGQKQRIAIARAILRDCPILLLDEATSALDAESEMLVQKALDGLIKQRTTLVIAHRLATVLKADRIMVIDKGKIVEQGTHDELVAKNGLYARLARLQFTTH